MKKTLQHIAFNLAVLMLPMTAWGADFVIKARLDSNSIVMGKTTVLHIELTQKNNIHGFWPNDRIDTLNAHVEILERPKADTIKLAQGGGVKINKSYVIQAFDSGTWKIDPIKFIAGTDTILSNPLQLTVTPVKVNTKGDIKDFASVIEAPHKFFDRIPQWVTTYWWIWVILLLLIATTLYYFLWWRKGKNPFKQEKKRIPPYDEAMQRLQLLKERQLWQNGREKEYYTALTDILREYIDRRFNINAIEMTSSQIMESLKNNEETKLVNEQLSEILAIADFVKFAGQRPLSDDNERSFLRALNFVQATKPAQQAEGNEGQQEKEVIK